MGKSKSLQNFLFLLLKLTSAIFLFYEINYDFNKNPDGFSYYMDYVNKNWSFDIGYELIVSFIRDWLLFDFDYFWRTYIILQVFLLLALYTNTLWFIALPNMLYMSGFFYGTQIRYSLAAIVFALILCKSRNLSIFKSLLPAFIHQSFIFISLLQFITSRLHGKIIKNSDAKNIFIVLMVFIGFCFGISQIIKPLVNIILSYTSYSGYINSQIYMAEKSSISIIYSLVSFLILSFAYASRLRHCTEGIIVLFCLILLMFITIFFGFAIISGRALLFYSVLEPICCYYLMREKRTVYLGIIILFMMITRFMILSVFSSNQILF